MILFFIPYIESQNLATVRSTFEVRNVHLEILMPRPESLTHIIAQFAQWVERTTCFLGLVRVRIPARARDNDLSEFPIEGCPLKPDTDSLHVRQFTGTYQYSYSECFNIGDERGSKLWT